MGLLGMLKRPSILGLGKLRMKLRRNRYRPSSCLVFSGPSLFSVHHTLGKFNQETPDSPESWPKAEL